MNIKLIAGEPLRTLTLTYTGGSDLTPPAESPFSLKTIRVRTRVSLTTFRPPVHFPFFLEGDRIARFSPGGGGGQDSKNFFRRFCDFSEKLFVKNEIKKCKFGYMGLNFSNVSGKRSLLKNAIKSEI